MPGKPALWPALVLNTVLRKPAGQLPLAGVNETIEVPAPPEGELLLVDPDELEGGVLGPVVLALVVGDEAGKTRFSPALVPPPP